MARKVDNARIAADDTAVQGDVSRSGGSGLRFATGAATATLTAFGLIAALAGPAAAVAGVTDASAALTPQHIGTAPRVPAGAVHTGSTPAGTTLHVAVNLQPRDPAALSSFISQVSDKSSPMYHRYLAAGQFAQTFGPAQSTIDSVEQALRNKGLTPGKVSSDGLSIPVVASASAVSRAFGTSLSTFRLADGTSAYINTSAPSMPSGVATQLSGITGLDSLSQMTGQHSAPVAAGSLQGGISSRAVASNVTSPTVCSGLTSSLEANKLYDTKNYNSPSALASAYGMTKSFTAGAGVTVGVFELENVSTANIAQYQSCLGTHSSVSYVPVDGGPTAPAAFSTGVGIESALDIEDLIGLAPGASIIDYEGPDAANATNQNVLDVYQAMVTADQAKVLSISWGDCDLDMDSGTLNSESNIFAEAAAQGQSVVSAAGDTGSTDCNRDSNTAIQGSLAVDDPSSQPYVTSVGGTRMSGSGSSLAQSVWDNNATWDNGGGAGGGGVSDVWSNGNATAPYNYQTGFTGSGYSNKCSAPSGQVCRQVPDVSALADPGTGYLVALNGTNWYIIGGTSGASPTWAALIAQADSTAACKANGSVGQLNPLLYTSARTGYGSSFYDVTSGSNDWTASGYKGGNYRATTGYDLASGLGTPKYSGLLAQLCGTKVGDAQGNFFPVANPAVIMDTRNGTGVAKAPLGANSTDVVQIAGVDGVPAMSTGLTSVVLTVTAIYPNASSYVAVSGDGIGNGAATVDFTPGQIIPNTVVVPLKDGKVDFYNRFGSVNVAAVVTGYYSTEADGSTYTGDVGTLLDTRSGTGIAAAGALGPNSTDTVQVTGAAGVPNDGTVTAVVLNLTAINGTSNSYIGVYPGTSGPSAATSVSFAPNEVFANTVIVPLGTDGTLKFYNFAGTVNVAANVAGYYSTSATGSTFSVVTPTHLLDTRNAAAPFHALGAGVTESLPVVGIGGVPANATAVALNVTAIGSTTGGYLSVITDGAGRTGSTGVYFGKGQTLANMVIVPVTDGKVDFYNNTGSVNIAVDVLGYYTGSTPQ